MTWIAVSGSATATWMCIPKMSSWRATKRSAETMSMSSYARQQAIEFQDLGYGSAASTLLFAVMALGIAGIMVAGRNA